MDIREIRPVIIYEIPRDSGLMDFPGRRGTRGGGFRFPVIRSRRAAAFGQDLTSV